MRKAWLLNVHQFVQAVQLYTVALINSLATSGPITNLINLLDSREIWVLHRLLVGAELF